MVGFIKKCLVANSEQHPQQNLPPFSSPPEHDAAHVLEKKAEARTLPPLGTRVGLIAGSGQLPLIFSKALLQPQYPLFVAAHVGEADPTIEQLAQDVMWVKLGQFKKIVRYMQKQQVEWIVMAGGIAKTNIWKIRPDSLALSIVMSLGTLHDDVLLRAFSGELEQRGFTVGSVTDFVPELLMPTGVLTAQAPANDLWQDIIFGWQAAKELGRLDIGQGVVVKRRVVISVEAMEGTDAMINRTGELIAGSGSGWANSGSAVLVKTAKPQQDKRLDLPTIGPRTIENLHKAGIKALAVEAGATMLLDPETTTRLADKYKIILIGCSEQIIQKKASSN